MDGLGTVQEVSSRVFEALDRHSGYGAAAGLSSPAGFERAQHHLAYAIGGEHGRAGDDRRSPLPRALVGQERELVAGPLLPEVRGRLVTAVTQHAAPLGFGQVRLDPDDSVQPGGEFATTRPDPLDDHQFEPAGHLDRPRSLLPDPTRRSVGHRLPGAQRAQYAVDEQLGPVEERVVPGHVVGVDDGRRPNDTAQLLGE